MRAWYKGSKTLYGHKVTDIGSIHGHRKVEILLEKHKLVVQEYLWRKV